MGKARGNRSAICAQSVSRFNSFFTKRHCMCCSRWTDGGYDPVTMILYYFYSYILPSVSSTSSWIHKLSRSVHWLHVNDPSRSGTQRSASGYPAIYFSYFISEYILLARQFYYWLDTDKWAGYAYVIKVTNWDVAKSFSLFAQHRRCKFSGQE